MKSHFKVCSKCGKEKPRTQFHKDASKRGGLGSHCKTCKNAYQKQWYKENYNYRSDYKKKWYQENRESQLEHSKQWYQENRESRLEYNRQWRQENREHYLESKRKWRKRNPEKYLGYKAKRRFLKKESAPLSVLGCPEERCRVEQIYKLRNLLTEATGIEHHVDHIWPLSKGGPHWSGNLQIITARENLSKGDTLCEETARVIQESLDEYCSARQ